MEIDRLIERFNSALKGQENATISVINRALDQSFATILRRVQAAIERGSASGAAYEVAVARELARLVPAVVPGEADEFLRGYERLLRESAKLGGNYGETLLRMSGLPTAGPGRVSITTGFSLPVEAAVAAAREARRFLERHGEDFAIRGAEVVARGVLEGRGTAAIVRELRTRLGVVKHRAEVIAQTESMRAYSVARDERFRAAGVEQVRWWATVDDRTCPLCRPRAGVLYALGQVQTPLHPRCRCTTTPWNRDVAALDPEYVAAIERHRAQVREAAPVDLNRGAILGAAF